FLTQALDASAFRRASATVAPNASAMSSPPGGVSPPSLHPSTARATKIRLLLGQGEVRVIDCFGAGGSAPRGQSLVALRATAPFRPVPPMRGLFGGEYHAASFSSIDSDALRARSSTYP